MYKRGITLLEILFVMAIMIIASLLTFEGLSNYRSREAVDVASREIASHLTEARTKTIASEMSSKYGVQFASTSVTVFKGTQYNPLASDNERYGFDASVTISALSLNGAATSTIFERLTGSTNNYGTITVTSVRNSSHVKTIIVEKTGLVKIQ